MDSGEPAVRLLDEIDLETVKINYDFGNLLSHCFEKSDRKKITSLCANVRCIIILKMLLPMIPDGILPKSAREPSITAKF